LKEIVRILFAARSEIEEDTLAFPRRPLAHRHEKITALNNAAEELREEGEKITIDALAEKASAFVPLKPYSLRLFIRKEMEEKELRDVGLRE
jgi:hypothetical protein